MLNIGWYSTGRGEGSMGLLRFVQQRILAGELDARIQFVFSNREAGEWEGSDRFFRQVHDYGLPLVNLSSRKFGKAVVGKPADRRLAYDREVMGLLEGFNPEVCVLAGYMLIVGEEICRRYTMLNLHPALPTGPTGTWQEVIWALIESKADRTGAMVHLVTEEVDGGPVVSYFTMPIVGETFDEHWREIEGVLLSELKASYGEDLPLFRIIRQEEYRREPYLLAATLQAMAVGDVGVKDGQVVRSGGESLQGLCLNEEIEVALVST